MAQVHVNSHVATCIDAAALTKQHIFVTPVFLFLMHLLCGWASACEFTYSYYLSLESLLHYYPAKKSYKIASDLIRIHKIL